LTCVAILVKQQYNLVSEHVFKSLICGDSSKLGLSRLAPITFIVYAENSIQDGVKNLLDNRDLNAPTLASKSKLNFPSMPRGLAPR